MLLLSIVYITYLHNSTTHTSIIYALFNPGIEFIPLLGLLSPTEIDGDRVLMLVRVSSASQGSNTSKSSQKAALNDAVKEIDGTVIEVLEAEESAADIERNQLTRTLEMAQEDLYDILMVYEVDRLSRADPWDTLRYLHDLQQSNITLYCDSHGFIDWAQYYDFEILTREAVFARRWLDRLRKGRVDGCEQKLRNGKWPFGGNPPVGYCTDDKNNLKLDQRYAKYVPDIFEIYLRTENRSETLRQINSKFEQENIEKTTYQRIKTVLQSKLVLGRLEYDGKLVTTNSQLQLVDKELFQDAQALQSKQGGRPESNSIPDFIDRGVRQYGPNFVFGLIDTFQPYHCRLCNGELKKHGSTQVWDIQMPNYQCTQCHHQGPLVTETELNELHQTLPLRCPYCIATEKFKSKELRVAGSKFDYVYQCEECENSFGSNMAPDKIERMLEHPELQFSVTCETKQSKPRHESTDDAQQTLFDNLDLNVLE